MAKWSILPSLAVPLLFVSACGGQAAHGGGSETGFLGCSVDAQCGDGLSCIASRCVSGKSQGLAETTSQPVSACDAAIELPSSDDAWWEAHLIPDLPVLSLPSCGDANNPPSAPAVVAKWIASHDGTFYAYAWSKDFKGVFGGATQCGTPGGCALLEPVPNPPDPTDATLTQYSGFNFDAKAGEAWYFTFQYLDPQGAPPPDHGTGIGHIGPFP